MSPTMFIVVILLALVLVGGFTFLWWKDRDRSEEEAHDPERLDSQTVDQPKPPPSG